MSDYAAPIADMRFVLNEIVGLGEIAGLPGYEERTWSMPCWRKPASWRPSNWRP